VAYWLADTWLESTGGRQLLERVLSERIGMNVRLMGEFDLMLLPAIGVFGTGLVISGPESEFARSEEFEISVALRPLVDRKVLIEWVRMTGGHIYPDRYARINESSKNRKEPGDRAAGVVLATKSSFPEIQELTIRNFQIVWPGEEETRLKVRELTVSGFADNRETPFALEIENLVAVDGKLRWDNSQSLIHFRNLQLDLAGQRVSGDGCLYLQAPGSLHFELQAGVFDLDAFRENLPGMGGGTGEGTANLPMDIRGRFTAEELSVSGAIARGVVFSLGGEPACKDFPRQYADQIEEDTISD
jgi:uncharacterized protein involved in outer membrane biogenesis